jgi:uncharacterized membrane protein
MLLLTLCLLIGVIAGLRALIAPAAVAWAAWSGWIPHVDGWPAFMGYRFTPWFFSIGAAAELVTDQLPSTPSRLVPPQFGARVVLGGLAGAALGGSAGNWIGGLVIGAIGAVAGTFAGASARSALARAFGHDRPAAILEDAVAIGGALLILWAA